jgi:hypothetical protein
MAEIKASLSLKGWNATQLRLRVPVILRRYGDVMDKQLKEEIQTVQFPLDRPWPRKTRRRNGTVVGSPRDIVDLGGFLRSQRREYPSSTQLVFSWDAKSRKGFMYAGLILTGYTTKRGTVVPGRNWIKPALDKHPLNSFFIQEWRKLSSNAL